MHRNEQRVREGYEAFGKADMETLARLFHDDIVWHVLNAGPLNGDHCGRQAVFDMFGRMFVISGGTLRVELIDACANDQRTFAIHRVSADLAGEHIEEVGTAVYEVDAEGRVTEAKFFIEDPVEAIHFDELWTRAAEHATV